MNNYTDTILEEKIKKLQRLIEDWARKRRLWTDSGFKSFFDETNEEPNENAAVVTVLWTEGSLYHMLQGYNHSDHYDEFYELVDQTEFYFECARNCIYYFYLKPGNDELNKAYVKYYEWQWICKLIKPNYTDLFQEVFEYFMKKPDKLYSLTSRQYEIFISEVFINQGYSSELGKGTNDGGVDIRLYQKDEVDQIVTLVQLKKYSPKRPIHLEAVSSLSAIVNQEKANRGLFVTTSRYLPGVKSFAEREGSRLTLADSTDVVRWCENARNIIVRDKSSILTDSYLLDLLKKEQSNNLVGKIVVANNGYGMTSNAFCIVVKEAKDVVLLMRVPSKQIVDENGKVYTVGHEIPVLNEEILKSEIRKMCLGLRNTLEKACCGFRVMGKNIIYGMGNQGITIGMTKKELVNGSSFN